MVNLSKKRIQKDVWIKLFNIFFVILNKKRSKKDFAKIILSILSYPEQVMLIKRIGLIYLLLMKIEKYKIRELLNVSRGTLDRYQLIIEKNKDIFDDFKNLIKKENIVNLFEEIFSNLYGPGTYGINWDSAWSRKKKIIRRKEYGI